METAGVRKQAGHSFSGKLASVVVSSSQVTSNESL